MNDTINVHREAPRACTKILTAFLVLVLLALCAAGCRTQIHPVRYPAAIDWQSYEAGLAQAKAEGKPVMLLFGADWCEPCHMLAENVLSDPRVIEASKGFVMVHVNVEQREDLDHKYQRGGRGLPRVYFLNAEGALLKAARHPGMCHPYQYDFMKPDSLLHGMAEARRLASDPATRPDEDPYERTPAKLASQLAEVCVPRHKDNACEACATSKCCAEYSDCVREGSPCICDKDETGRGRKAITACVAARCGAVCGPPGRAAHFD